MIFVLECERIFVVDDEFVNFKVFREVFVKDYWLLFVKFGEFVL